MLAIKAVMADRERVGTMIFDEVDTGVSGRAAQKVAEKLRSVAAHKQVLCVTHSAQIAALADTHLLVSKREDAGRTKSLVRALDSDGRVEEIARIIGGINVGEATLNAARELISEAATL